MKIVNWVCDNLELNFYHSVTTLNFDQVINNSINKSKARWEIIRAVSAFFKTNSLWSSCYKIFNVASLQVSSPYGWPSLWFSYFWSTFCTQSGYLDFSGSFIKHKRFEVSTWFLYHRSSGKSMERPRIFENRYIISTLILYLYVLQILEEGAI